MEVTKVRRIFLFILGVVFCLPKYRRKRDIPSSYVSISNILNSTLPQRICFFRCLHVLTSSSSSCCLYWLPSNYKKDWRACWKKPPRRAPCGLSFLENPQCGLGHRGNASPWSDATDYSAGVCTSIMTKNKLFHWFQACFWAFLGFSCSESVQQIDNLRSWSININSRTFNTRYPKHISWCLWGSFMWLTTSICLQHWFSSVSRRTNTKDT